MIDNIRKEPLFKKMIILSTVTMMLIGIIFLSFQYFFLNRLYNIQFQENKAMVGRLVSIYPQNEVEIVRTALNKEDAKYIKIGQGILKKYGYDEKSSIFENEIQKKYLYKIGKYNVLAFIILGLLNISLILYAMKYFTEKIEKFSTAIDKIMDDDFSMNMYSYEDGMLSRLTNQFEEMSRRLKMSMKNLEREKEGIKSLVTDVSHQLKTPIASIKMFNSLLLEDEITEEERTEFLTRSKYDVNRLEWLAGSLIKISRLETGMIELKKEKLNIKNTIIQAVNDVYIKANEKNIDINVENIESVNIKHDGKWTKEAIFNILENAIKYTNEGGKVSVETINSEAFVRIDIKDSGIGIPDEEINDIFKRFYRGKSNYVQNKEGSGIGLYLTRKIIESQYGSIVVSSNRNAGTEFNIYLQKS